MKLLVSYLVFLTKLGQFESIIKVMCLCFFVNRLPR